VGVNDCRKKSYVEAVNGEGHLEGGMNPKDVLFAIVIFDTERTRNQTNKRCLC